MLYWPRARQREESAANGAFSMKRSVFLALISLAVIALVAGGCGGGSSVARLGSDDVAVVGSKGISKTQFQGLMDRAKKSYETQKRAFPKPGTAEYETLKGQAIAFLLQRAEFEQEAEARGIDISDEKIDKRIAQLKKQFYGGSDKKYQDTLKQQGLTEEQAREEVRASLISEELFKKVTGDVKVSQKEIRSYYDSHKTQYGQPESREVRHILVQKKALADLKPAQTTPLSKVEASIRQQLEQQQKNDAMTKWVEKTKKHYCGDTRIKYQVGYQPATDPCLTVTSSTATQ